MKEIVKCTDIQYHQLIVPGVNENYVAFQKDTPIIVHNWDDSKQIHLSK